jgi:hypothetical protein
MLVIRGGNYAYTRVGYSCLIPVGLPTPAFYVRTGRFLQVPGGPRMEEWQFLGYPIVLDQDTVFLGTNFAQQYPHTEGVFQIEPGVRVVFGILVDGLVAELATVNLENVTIPDEVAPEDIGNIHNAQLVYTDTGNPDFPVLATLHECPKCVTFVRAVREEIVAGRFQRHRCLGLVKPIARGRRQDLAQADADLDFIKAENAAALDQAKAFRKPVAEDPTVAA